MLFHLNEEIACVVYLTINNQHMLILMSTDAPINYKKRDSTAMTGIMES